MINTASLNLDKIEFLKNIEGFENSNNNSNNNVVHIIESFKGIKKKNARLVFSILLVLIGLILVSKC